MDLLDSGDTPNYHIFSLVDLIIGLSTAELSGLEPGMDSAVYDALELLVSYGILKNVQKFLIYSLNTVNTFITL